MTSTEFEKQARRAAIAFGAPPNAPSKITELSHHTVQTTCARFQTENFDFVASFHRLVSKWSFDLEKGKLVLELVGWPDDPSIYSEGDCSKFEVVVARGMFLLGFDISFIEEWFEFTITAHEKLEWQLEFQRRLREETSQIE